MADRSRRKKSGKKRESVEKRLRELEGRIRSLEGFVHSKVEANRILQLEEAVKRLALRQTVFGPSGGRRSPNC